MDTKFEALPPLKRLRILQQQENKENEFQLPSKKRKESRHSFPPEPISTFCLPAKKRVSAFQPDFDSGTHPFSPLDLNVEYKPEIQFKPSKDCESTIRDSDVQNDMKVEGNKFENNDNAGKIADAEEEKIQDEVDDDGILCAICHSTDGDPTDPIVFCDGCDLMVHTTCYGNPLIKGVPDGDWFCAKCLYLKSESKRFETVSCVLCTTKTGALKPTKDGKWAHIVCAVLVPEVFFDDPDGREGINCSKVPKKRWDGKCCVCKSRKGCVIECSEPKCELEFHVTCGLNEDFCIEFKEGRRKDETIVAGFCKSHSELWEKQQRTGKFKIVAREEQNK